MKAATQVQADPTKIEIILSAAKKRFAHFGLAKTTMNEIAADIGMSKASLYYYFPDKEHLFVAVMDVEMAGFVSTIEHMIEKSGKSGTKLRHYATLRTGYFKQFLDLGKLESNSVAALMNPAHDSHKNKFLNAEKSLIRKILQNGISEGEFSRMNLESHADLIVTGMMGFRMLALKNKSYVLNEDDHQQLQQHTSLFLEVVIKAISKS